MMRDDVRIETVLVELADLGRRIGQRAGELARLTAAGQRSPLVSKTDATDRLVAVAADLAAGVDAAVARRSKIGRPSAGLEPGGAAPHHTGSTRGSRESATVLRRPLRHTPKRQADKTTALPQGVHGRRLKPVRGHDGVLAGIQAGHRWRKAIGPLAMSTAVHVVAMIALGMTFVFTARREPVTITLGMVSEEVVEDSSPIMIVDELPQTDNGTGDGQEALAPLPTVEAMAAMLPPVLDPVGNEALPTAPTTESPTLTSLESADFQGMLAEIGRAGATAGGRAGRQRGQSAAGDNATFFGRTGEGRSVCFLCDNSNSHSTGGFHVVLEEVARAVDALPADRSFFVVFFSDDAYPLFHPDHADALVPATPDNKRRLRSWLATVEMCRGGPGIHEAVRLAERLDPDAVYLLSDGQFSATVVDRVGRASFGDAVVHTFGIQQAVVDRLTGQVDPERLLEQQGWNRNLITIATAHGGVFTPVNIPPAAAVLERVRPIPRNRSRGAVWGLRL